MYPRVVAYLASLITAVEEQTPCRPDCRAAVVNTRALCSESVIFFRSKFPPRKNGQPCSGAPARKRGPPERLTVHSAERKPRKPVRIDDNRCAIESHPPQPNRRNLTLVMKSRHRRLHTSMPHMRALRALQLAVMCCCTLHVAHRTNGFRTNRIASPRPTAHGYTPVFATQAQ